MGIALALGNLALMVIVSGLVKWLGGRFPVGELLFFRFAFALLPLLFFLGRTGGVGALRTTRPIEHALRCIFGVASISFFFTAITLIPLADATAIFFSAPLFVTALSVPLLGEAVGIRRWSAVLTGLLGVFILANPAGADLGPGIAVAVASAVFSALVTIWLRRLSRTEVTATIAIYYNGFGMLVCGVWALAAGWVVPGWPDLVWLVALGLIGGVGQYVMTASFRFADASLLAPLDYLSLVCAAGIGYAIWNEVPSAATWTGAAIIVASGLFMIYRETQLMAKRR